MLPTAPSRSRSSLLAAALAIFFADPARAQLYSPGARGVTLSEFADPQAKAPTILLPVFARCTGTCPAAALKLKEGLAKSGRPFRVVLFSFDAADAPKDLEAFRTGLGLPAEWRVVTTTDAAAARGLLDRVGFAVMTQKNGFAHPDAAFVLSPTGAWTGTFYGGIFEEKDLRDAYRRATSPGGGLARIAFALAALAAAAGLFLLLRRPN